MRRHERILNTKLEDFFFSLTTNYFFTNTHIVNNKKKTKFEFTLIPVNANKNLIILVVKLRIYINKSNA